MRAEGKLEQGLEHWVRRHRPWVPGGRVVVAVSGGSDSSALLYLLAGRAATWGLQLAVAHFDHGWRAEAGEDAAWVEAAAQRLGLPFFLGRGEPPPAGGNREQAGREARYRFLLGVAAQLDPERPAAVATGHTADDQAETVLLRLMRGAGNAGLAGILPVRGAGPSIVRPLLFARRAALQAWLLERGLSWREDVTNLDPRPRRNWIRQELLPRMHAANPAIVERLGTMAEVAREEEDFWDHYLASQWTRVWSPQGTGWRASRPAFACLKRALQRRLLREAVRRVQGDLRRVAFADIEAVVGWIGEASTWPRQRQVGRCECRVTARWVEVVPAAALPAASNEL